MKIVFDIEANGLNPTEVFVIVAREVNSYHSEIFREVTKDAAERERFLNWSKDVTCWIGHNILSYDLPVLYRLVGLPLQDISICLDTYILSKLVDYPRSGHSLEDYGEEFGIEKNKYSDFTRYSAELEERCITDVTINTKVYLKYKKYIDEALKESFGRGIPLEHKFQGTCNNLSNKGFALDVPKAKKELDKVLSELKILDLSISEEFLPKLKLIRTVIPKKTKYGTISLTSIPKSLRSNIHELTVDAPFSYCHWSVFNPNSHKQIVEVLNQAGWSPVDKTDTHKDKERELSKLRRLRKGSKELDIIIQKLIMDLERLEIYGWKVNEANLGTLPNSAPNSARTLAKRILYESRRRTLVEWLSLVKEDGRVYGEFHGIGAWTHRMAHRKPNLANITNEFDTAGNIKLLGKELRQCWRAPKGRLLVGVDAEGIQLRIFAHYVNNAELIKALVSGDKKLKTDPHSYNQGVLGNVCKSRAAAKRFLYALFLGAGMDKLATILECGRGEAELALDRLLDKYPGFSELKTTIIPSDAKRGWFTGIDGRKVRIPGEDIGSRRHLAMSGYLQNGEAVVMKTAAVIAEPQLKQYNSFIVDIVHDEAQNETPNNMEVALEVAKVWDLAIRKAGDIYDLKCPMAGSYMNDHGEYTIGTNWYKTH